MKKSLTEFGYLLIILFLILIISGYVLMNLWKWFISTTFHLPNITLVQSIGLTLFGSHFLKSAQKGRGKDFYERALKPFIEFIGYALVVLGIGWVIYQFI